MFYFFNNILFLCKGWFSLIVVKFMLYQSQSELYDIKVKLGTHPFPPPCNVSLEFDLRSAIKYQKVLILWDKTYDRFKTLNANVEKRSIL